MKKPMKTAVLVTIALGVALLMSWSPAVALQQSPAPAPAPPTQANCQIICYPEGSATLACPVEPGVSYEETMAYCSERAREIAEETCEPNEWAGTYCWGSR